MATSLNPTRPWKPMSLDFHTVEENSEQKRVFGLRVFSKNSLRKKLRFSRLMETSRFRVFFFFCLLCLMRAFTASGIVLLKDKNTTMSFEDIEADFAPPVKGSGICGTLHVAEPLDGCSILTNKVVREVNQTKSPFVLIIRGGCGFDDKVKQAQAAGFKAAIIYNNENGYLVSMAGNSAGIKIHAVFISKAAGETLSNYASAADVELCVIPSFGNSAWSIMAVSFISLLAMSAVMATCFFVRRHRIRREGPQDPVSEFHGMGSRLVKAMPTLIFTAVTEDYCTSATCAICLEDYNPGEKLRILPCRHKFHAICVDGWLTKWRTFCPVCKRDARTNNRDPPASESTPLLSSVSSSVLSSAIPISYSSSSRSLSVSRPESLATSSYANSSYNLHSHGNRYPYMGTSRSTVELRTNSPYLVSPHSLGYPSLSPLNSRYMSPYIPSPGNGSSIRQANLLHHSGSTTSFSTYASVLSLPEC